jgi:hypothetical protein
MVPVDTAGIISGMAGEAVDGKATEAGTKKRKNMSSGVGNASVGDVGPDWDAVAARL